jgi:hypothetical protein
MATKTAYLSPGSTATIDRGATYKAWSNPGNIVSSNNSRATCSSTGTDTGTDSLEAYNFGFSIPANAIVTKVYVTIEASIDVGGSLEVLIEPDRTARGPIYAGNESFTSTEGTQEAVKTITAGDEPTAAQVNSSNFAVYVQDATSTDSVYSVDHISVAIEYELLNPNLFWANNF